MELRYPEDKRLGKLNILFEVAVALLLGGSMLYMIISMFGLHYSVSDMFDGGVVTGAAGIWNQAADRLGSLDYIILPKYEADIAEGGVIRCGLSLTVLFVMLSAVSFLVIRSKSRLLVIMLTIPFAVSMFLFHLAPSALAGALFAGMIIVVLSIVSIRGRIRPVLFAVPLIAVLIGTGGVLALENTVSLNEPAALAKVGSSCWQTIDKARYGSDVLPQGDLGKVTGKDLKDSRGSITEIKDTLSSVNDEKNNDEKAEDVALSITMSEPYSYYLRGYVGAEYEKNSWNTLSDDTFYDMRDKIFWMNRRGFDGLSEVAYASELGGTNTNVSDITINVKNASKRIAFTPYELYMKAAEGEKARESEMRLPKGTKNYGGSHLGTKGFTGRATYSYKAAGNLTGLWTDAVGKLYTAAKTDEISRFFITESHYNVIQYDKYLNIPESLITVFEREVGKTGDISQDHADYKETMETIRNYFRQKYIYSDTFAEPEPGKDFVQSFVEGKRGADIHFATLATLLFRYYGIPARYVEGYLVTPANVQGKTGATEVDVMKQANHAWTEIYIDGFGWIPFEATPEYIGIMREADLTRGLQNVDYESSLENRTSVEEEPPEETENEQDDSLQKLLIMILRIVLITLVSAAVLFILFRLGLMIWSMVKWRKAFADKDPKTGIRALYQYSILKEWKLSEAGESIGLAASYSETEMTESERTRMRAELKKAEERAKQEKASARKQGRKADSGKGKQAPTEQKGEGKNHEKDNEKE